MPSAATAGAPYADSRYEVQWDFDATIRLAHGSDLWPCAPVSDGHVYCAWGDGGGFDGDSDSVGRVSLGFARLSGAPGRDLVAKNVWGAPPWAEVPATFGGKVGSLIEADGRLLASGRFWRPSDTPDAVHKGGAGPYSSIAWSTDNARSWTLDAWAGASAVAAFLDRGPDPHEGGEYLYLYYFRAADDVHLYLKRARARDLASGRAPHFEFYAGPRLLQRWTRWSGQEGDAVTVFVDRNHVEGPSVTYVRGLGRHLLTTGHYPGSDDNLSSSGKWGLFEAPHPWGPWRTVGYYENWANIDERTRGDYLGFRLPSPWASGDGREIWGVYSGLAEFDSLNLIRGRLMPRR